VWLEGGRRSKPILTARNLMLSLCIGELSHTGTDLPSFNASPVSAPAPRSADSSQMLTVNSTNKLLSRQRCQLSVIKSSDWRIAARGTSAFPSALNKALKDCHHDRLSNTLCCAVSIAGPSGPICEPPLLATATEPVVCSATGTVQCSGFNCPS
jgi:hypothetical protein